MTSILLVIGTRPELIKMAPLAKEFDRRGLTDEYKILNTAQHKELLDPYWDIFNMKPHYVLDIMSANSNLSVLTARALIQLQQFIDDSKVKPSVIVAQGDTTSVMASSVVAFYNRIKFVHLEAGLRSFDFSNPFPEEFNRKVAAINCDLHLAPTSSAKQNLIQEGYREDKVKVVGNTVVDALEYIKRLPDFETNRYLTSLNRNDLGKKIVLITCHRRENHGNGLINIVSALKTLASTYPNHIFVWPRHPNPNVMRAIAEARLENYGNFRIVPPLGYTELLSIMQNCAVIISDSGGIQEEAPSFNVPVLILREKTERPEGVQMGIAHLVGSDAEKIVVKFKEVEGMPCHKFENPYGDGKAAARIVDLLLQN